MTDEPGKVCPKLTSRSDDLIDGRLKQEIKLCVATADLMFQRLYYIIDGHSEHPLAICY